MKLTDFGAGMRRNRKQEDNDLGFGTKIGSGGERLINRDGSFNVVRTGNSTWTPYQSLVEMPWGHFLGLIVLFYLVVNLAFATLFIWIGIESISDNVAERFWENYTRSFF